MSLAKGSLRTHAIDLVRREIAAGNATPEKLKRWEVELGPVVRELEKELAPKKGRKAAAETPAS